MDMISTANPELELVADFVNTNDIEGRRDHLGTPEQLSEWLAERGVAPAGSRVSPELHRRAIAVREGIRALGRANNGEPPRAEQLEAMNRAAAAYPVRIGLTDGEWSLAPMGSGVDAFLARVMAAVARAMADDTWSRVKSCRNDRCRWLFIDHSRNHSATWCSMRVCGSRSKARAYRARRREAAEA
ncbi:MAG TPA: ABATE domain-containing protein [Candidatus Limnocylindria bacterium]|nr:ABATE domain-containing protein [Candidatus Limnocylindria bacterium]